MSIAELSSAFGGPMDGAPPDERVPPQDLGAEQSVLGSMLLNKDAIADSLELVKGHDFYRPAHELIYDAILDLFGRGEPADAITVADELTKRGDLTRVGGQAYLHQLIQSVPTAANAGYYAEIVHERAVLRRLVEAGTRIVQMGYGQGEGDVDDIVNRAQAEVYSVAEKRGGEDYVRLSDVLEETLTEIEAASGRTDEFIGVPTGFIELDQLTHGLHPGQMIVVAARPAVGKALALDTPLPTPTGWTTMGEVRVGDELLDASGRPTRVVEATEVMRGRPCYEVEFSDGTVVVADAEHQWLTDTRASRRSRQAARDRRQVHQGTLPAVRTTREIAASLRTATAERRLNHSVRLAEPLDLPERSLPVAPYVLGAWLGDGTSEAAQITTADDEMVMHLEAEGLMVVPTASRVRYTLRLPTVATPSRHGHGTLQARLRSLGVLGSKHIPLPYLRSSERQRRALLAGLLDTDGTVTRSGVVQFTTTSARLAEDVGDLLSGLGYRYGLSTKDVRGRAVESSTAFTLTFSSDVDVFRLTRKEALHKERRGRRFQRRDSRFIVDVRPIEPVPVRCVEVANSQHLYLAGRTMIPTHNSTLGIDIARAAAIKHKLTTAVFSLEMSKTEITMRILSAEATLQLQDIRKGLKGQEQWNKLARIMGKISDSPLFIDDSPNMSLMEIRAKCRRLKQQHDLKLVIIDYLQLMSSGKKVESRQQEVAEFSRALKLLAKELEVPVIAISQLNRGPEQRTDKRPQMSDLRESGCLTADTRILRADTGAETTIGEIARSGERDLLVWALDDGLRYTRRTMTHAFSTGVREVHRLTTSSGKSVQATANHPFLTPSGWKPLGELRAGEPVAVPRHVPSPVVTTAGWTDSDLYAAAVQFAANAPDDQLASALFSLPKHQIAGFLRSAWELLGWVSGHEEGEIGVSHLSPAAAEGVARLLLRFGIQTRQEVASCGGDTCIVVDGVDSQRRFLQEVGTGPRHAEQAGRLLATVRGVASDVESVDERVWQEIETRLTDHGSARRSTATLLDEVSATLDEASLELAATNDVAWDRVERVDRLGRQEVFDATVLDCHNFIADGIAVHNSIEQDADVVILLHRDRSDPERDGEADVIVAKHRNGPTKDIVLAFQGHYSRFSNMARDGF